MNLVCVDLRRPFSESLTAFGPLLTFERPLCAHASARRGRRHPVGPGGGSCRGGRRRAPTPLRCSAWRRAANSLRSLRSLRSNRRGESVLDARCARRRQSCAARRPRNRPHQAPPGAACRAGTVRLSGTKVQCTARELGFDFRRNTDHRRCRAAGAARRGSQWAISVAASSAAESERSADRHSMSPLRAPAGSACRAALSYWRTADLQRTATGRKQPSPMHRRSMRRGPRESQWSK